MQLQRIIISTELWFVPLCVLAGVIYAVFLYYREHRYEFSAGKRLIMGAMRAVTVAFIAFFLLSPFFRSTSRKIEEPVIIIAQDASGSIKASGDSVFYKSDYPVMMNTLIEALEQDYEVHTYSFGENIRDEIDFAFDDKKTDIAKVIEEINSKYVNRNVGAMILASDGLYNQGIHPYYVVDYLSFPMYTIALGDTTPVRDASVVDIAHNRIAYLNNTFPLEVHVKGTLCDGLNTTMKVIKDNRVVFTEQISFSGNNDSRFIPVELLAEEPGFQQYIVELTPVEGERSLINNVKEVFIEVLESRQKILILYNAPHPDIAAIRQALESHQNYDVEVYEASMYTGNPEDFNLVVLHQIPSRQQANVGLIRELNDTGLPLLHILGSASDLKVFNTMGYGLTISDAGSRLDEALPALSPAFNLFTLSDEFNEVRRFFPPLFSPYGNYRESVSGNVLFYKQIGSVVSGMPLMLFSNISGKKIAVIAGEGIWRWRLANFSRRENHLAFDEWLSKSIQYLALHEQKERFIVQSRNIWDENEVIEFYAELYNESFELINSPEVELIISDEDGQEYPFTFSRIRDAYKLKAGAMAPEKYAYSASVQWQDETYEASGIFSVVPLQVELTNTVADHRLLYGLADQFDGKMFFPSEMVNIVNTVQQRDEVKPVFYLEKSYLELIDVKSLLALIIALLSAEWIFRRIAGGY
jgi:hypothetical protein